MRLIKENELSPIGVYELMAADIDKAELAISKTTHDERVRSIAESLAAERASLPESVLSLMRVAEAMEWKGHAINDNLMKALAELKAWKEGK